MTILRSTWRLWLYVLSSLGVFLVVALPVLRGDMQFKFYVDTMTYERIARTMPLSFDLVQIGVNLFGPVLVLNVLGGNRFLVYLFNVACLVAAFVVVARSFPVNRLRLLFYLMVTPLMFTSLLSINKEIMAVAAIAFFAAYYASGRRWQLAVALATSFLVRWQMTLFMLVFMAMASPLNPLRRRRFLSLLLLTVAISVVYVQNLATFHRLDQVAALGAREAVEGSGLYQAFISVQNKFGYFLVFLPKTLHQMVGPLSRVDKVTDMSNFFNNDVLFFHSLATVILLGSALWRRRIRLDLDPIYIAAVYAAVFGLSPIFSPRYFLPIYVLVAIAVALRPAETQVVPSRRPVPALATG
jgi:hypothetical protein